MSKRTHKKKIEAGRKGKGLSPEQIKNAKNQGCKQRNEQKREENKKKTKKKLEEWRSLTTAQQLEELAKRPGKCEKQLKRISHSRKDKF